MLDCQGGGLLNPKDTLMLSDIISFGQRIWGEIQRSSRWPSVRAKFLKGKSCSACGTKKNLEAHHVIPLAHGGEELEESNLIGLCRNCHYFIGHLQDWTSFNCDVHADSASYLQKHTNRPKLIKPDEDEPLI